MQTFQEDTDKTQSLSNFLDKSYFQSYVHNLGAFYGNMQNGFREGLGIQLYRGIYGLKILPRKGVLLWQFRKGLSERGRTSII